MKIRDISVTDAQFFLKAEYGPISLDWPVVAFSNASFESQIRRSYRTGKDFIVYLGTQNEETIERRDRGALLSIVEIDTTRVYNTYDHIASDARAWAEKSYPGRWLRCLRATRAYDLIERPVAAELLNHTDRNMWHTPFRHVAPEDRAKLLELDVAPIADIDILGKPGRSYGPADLLRPENQLAAQEACRLATLVQNRVNYSGQMVTHRSPQRTAPTDLQVQILALLLQKPLLCALCSGPMPLTTTNKLLKISGDRKNSALGDYGPENYQLVHLACNLAKNSATEEDFHSWLQIAASSQFQPNTQLEN